jgi:hypothetical protein
MLNFLSDKRVLFGSLALTLIMFSIVMFWVNPAIDGGNGVSIIRLQLAFDKEAGQRILNSWTVSGLSHFNQWIFTDYLYAFAYATFFASLLSWLVLKKGVEGVGVYRFSVYLAFIAGLLDWTENTIELLFINHPAMVSNSLFFTHSIVSVAKWSAIPIAITYIVVLLRKDDVVGK